jgi:hypothetical protein
MARHVSSNVKKHGSGHRRGSAEDKDAPKWWEKFTSLPSLVVTTVVSVLVTWLVTQGLAGVERQREIENAVTVSVLTNPMQVLTFSGDAVKVAMPPQTEVAPDPGGKYCEEFHPTLIAQGGADVGKTRLQVVVQGSTDSAVLISKLRAVVTKREEPLDGVVAVCSPEGEAQVRPVQIDLDAQNAVAKDHSGDKDFGYTVAKDETETFLVTAETQECFCEWHLELELVVAGERQYRELRNGEQPFRTSAAPARSRELWWDWLEGKGWQVFDWQDDQSHVSKGFVRPGEAWPDLGE